MVNFRGVNALKKNITCSAVSSKASVKSQERKSRQNSYKKKFGSHPHMIIPEEDLIWAEEQRQSVMKLFMQCWRSDPYGSRWQVLNHTLKPSSFKTAKKILSEAGLFTFRPQQSIRDARETVCWEVLNLHGARRNDYWLEQNSNDSPERGLQASEPRDAPRSGAGDSPSKEIEAKNLTQIKAKNLAQKSKKSTSKANDLTLEAKNLTSIGSQTQSEQGFQNPSETSQERLRNSSKEFQKTLPVDDKDGESDRSPALEGQIANASPKNEMEEVSGLSVNGFVAKDQTRVKPKNSLPSEENFSAWSVHELLKLDIENMTLEQLKSLPVLCCAVPTNNADAYTEYRIRREAAINKLIEADKINQMNNPSSEGGIALVRAKINEIQEKRKADRIRRLEGPVWNAEHWMKKQDERFNFKTLDTVDKTSSKNELEKLNPLE